MVRGLKAAIWLAALGPLAWLGWGVWSATADLGPNPVETLEHWTGIGALRLLLLTLAMTPLRDLVSRPEPVLVRRLLGLWAFAYATIHFALYVGLELAFDPALLADDLIKRRFITVGFLAWLLMLPLAITSTRGWQRRLKRRWKTLHRATYAAGLLAALHFLWLVKSDLREPALYAGIFLVLMALRLPWRRWFGSRAATA